MVKIVISSLRKQKMMNNSFSHKNGFYGGQDLFIIL